MNANTNDKNVVICEEILSLKQVKRKRKNSKVPSRVASSFDAAAWISRLIGSESQENLIVLCLNTKNEIVSYSVVFTGTLNQSTAHPRDILQRALLSNAASILIAHNHPSGCTDPSKSDDLVTQRLYDACKIFGIRLLDHIIVNDKANEYMSYREDEKIIV